MARPKDQALRERVIDAATQAFSERGFAGASMAEIGLIAGVTKGGVYFHFRSKEELFFAVLDHWRGELRRVGEGDQSLREYLRGYLAFHFRHPEAVRLLRVLSTELQGRFTAQVREDLRNAQRTVRARIRELLLSGVQAGALFTSDVALATFMLASAVEGVLSQWISSPRDAEPFCDPETLVDFLLMRYETGRAPTESTGQEKEAGADFLPPF